MSKAKQATDIDALKARFQTGAYVPFPLKNVILRHPHLEKPDTEFDPGGDGKYKCCLIVPEEVAKDMEAVGFNVKTFDDGSHYVQATRKPSLGKPTVVDEEGNVISGDIIGNDSIADCDVTTKFWNIGSNPSQALYIEKIVITDLVKYEGSADPEFDPF